MVTSVVARCVLLQIVSVGGLSTWTYEEGSVGPSDWGGQCTQGRSQSPIDLVANTSKPIERWSFSNSYRYKVPCTITNDGNSVKFTFETSKPTTISGVELNGDFVFSHGLFHWGSTDTEGSEHLVKGESFPLEIQFVHYNTKYGSYNEAEGKNDGLAVVSVLHKLSDTDNRKLSPVIDSLNQTTHSGTSFILDKEIRANSLYPTLTSPLYRYTGSLTTPPCTEMVTWSVLYHTNTVSGAQLAKLRSLLRSDGKPMKSTFRPTRHLNSRNVLIGSAWLDKKETPKTSTETIKPQKEYLQMSSKADTVSQTMGVKAAELDWYNKPVPVWTLVLGAVLVVVGGVVVAFLLVKRRLATHARVPTDDLEME